MLRGFPEDDKYHDSMVWAISLSYRKIKGTGMAASPNHLAEEFECPGSQTDS